MILLYDGGVLTPAQISAIRLPADELADWAFVAPDQVPRWVPAPLGRQVTAAVRASADGTVAYLEDGYPVS